MKTEQKTNKKRYLYILITIIIVASLLTTVFLFQTEFTTKKTNPAGTIDYSNTYATISTLFQRKTFFAQGSYWLFYSNGTNIFYTSSTNGLQWQKATPLTLGDSSSAFSIWYNGNVYYANAPGSQGLPISYAEGQINNQSIVWNNQQTAVQESLTSEYYNAYVTIDSTGTPWVCYQLFNDSAGNNAWSIQVTKADSPTGTSWSAPTQITDSTYFTQRATLLPLSDGKMYAIFATQFGIKGRLWNGNQWQPAENITNRSPVHDFGYSAVSAGDKVYLVTSENQTNNIFSYSRLEDQTWQENLLATNQETNSAPVLSIDPSSGTLYCTFFKNNEIQIAKSENGNWNMSPSTGLTLTSPQALSSFYQITDGKLGVASLELMNTNNQIYRLRYFIFNNP